MWRAARLFSNRQQPRWPQLLAIFLPAFFRLFIACTAFSFFVLFFPQRTVDRLWRLMALPEAGKPRKIPMHIPGYPPLHCGAEFGHHFFTGALQIPFDFPHAYIVPERKLHKTHQNKLLDIILVAKILRYYCQNLKNR